MKGKMNVNIVMEKAEIIEKFSESKIEVENPFIGKINFVVGEVTTAYTKEAYLQSQEQGMSHARELIELGIETFKRALNGAPAAARTVKEVVEIINGKDAKKTGEEKEEDEFDKV